MFKKRVKTSQKVAESTLAVEAEAPPPVPAPPAEEDAPRTPEAEAPTPFVEIPMSLLGKKRKEPEAALPTETPAQTAVQLKLQARIQENYRKYADPEYQIQKKAAFRSATNIDFNPSICKDFHDSGYCSWGDSCLYAHDRTNYKRGWELDKEWEDQQRAQMTAAPKSTEHSADCPVCKGDFREPVKTNCGHFFCEDCILTSFKKSKNCPVCQKKLNGAFGAVSKEELAARRAGPTAKTSNIGRMSDYLRPRPTEGASRLADPSEYEPVVVHETDLDLKPPN